MSLQPESAMNGTFLSGGLQLARYLVKPSGKTGALPAMVLCHGYPSGGIDARHSAGTFPELAERVANELGWNAMTFTFRGCATSEGDFSMQGWVDDLRAAITHVVAETSPSGIWIVGNNTGGKSLACNVGTGKGTSVLDVLNLAEQVSGRKVPYNIVGRRSGDPVSVYADPTLIRALLGWKATRDVRDIISSAWNWHERDAAAKR